ncbi:capsular polysaccharide transport system permease protein [Phyllobacterium trifolii]|uniref:Transport permease protein n=1 Tax=Phyllobacterium trifolii TaxID=300193 RepID=A0A839UJ02_9HYPH|nr:ABC transporter permease [Phyllobacterium trifolii]MBB3149754.1 capsular polysaccharide transport system permease protein [Phyllobacterium trifolii]
MHIFHSASQSGRVIVAIVLRETKTRFGKHKLGYLWALIEPMAYISVLLFIRLQLHASIPFGESYFLFFITGMISYRMYQSIAGRTMKAISANKSLLTYPLVKPTDAIAARVMLESLTMLAVLGIFFSILAFVSSNTVIHYPDRFFAAIATIIFLGAGVGTFNAVVSLLMPVWERIWTLLNFPMLFLSGIFYLPKELPEPARTLLSWNPVLHCVEWVRFATYLDYDPLLDRSYVITIALLMMTIGLLLERTYRNVLVRP